jgi:hypothetical protein
MRPLVGAVLSLLRTLPTSGSPAASCSVPGETDVDSDGICGDVDSCPLDGANDVDGDNLCFGDDPCPSDADNDADSDYVCSPSDTCPLDALNDADADAVCAADDPCPFDAADNCAWPWLGALIAVVVVALVALIVGVAVAASNAASLRTAADRQRALGRAQVEQELKEAAQARAAVEVRRRNAEREVVRRTQPQQRVVAAVLRTFFRDCNPARVADAERLAAHYAKGEGSSYRRLHAKLLQRYGGAPVILLRAGGGSVSRDDAGSGDSAAGGGGGGAGAATEQQQGGPELANTLRVYFADYAPALLPTAEDMAVTLVANRHSVAKVLASRQLLLGASVDDDGDGGDGGGDDDRPDDSDSDSGSGSGGHNGSRSSSRSRSFVLTMSDSYRTRLGALGDQEMRYVLFSFFFCLNPFELRRVRGLVKTYTARFDGTDEARRARLFEKLQGRFGCVPDLRVLERRRRRRRQQQEGEDDRPQRPPQSRLLNFVLHGSPVGAAAGAAD